MKKPIKVNRNRNRNELCSSEHDHLLNNVPPCHPNDLNLECRSKLCRKYELILNKILAELKCLNQTDTASLDKENKTYKFAAMVIDRACLWLFTITTLLSFLFFMFTSKNFFRFT